MYMKIKKDFFEKLSGAYDLLCSRINNCHNGGSSLEGLSIDSEFTLGLDNRGEAFGTGWIVLLVAAFVFVGCMVILQTITNVGIFILGVIFALLASLAIITSNNSH